MEPLGQQQQQEFVRPSEMERRRESVARTLVGISSTEAVLGGAAVVLGVLGLIGVFPLYMACIATIAIGASLLVEGGGIASRYSQLSALNGRGRTALLGAGTSAEVIGGMAGITLGILALVGVQSMILLPVAVIVFGGTLVFGTSATTRATAALESYDDSERRTAQDTVMAAENARVLVGLGAVTLGILVLADVGVPMVLILVSMLALGGMTLLSGSALGARSSSFLH
jgi:hypothetical protein